MAPEASVFPRDISLSNAGPIIGFQDIRFGYGVNHPSDSPRSQMIPEKHKATEPVALTTPPAAHQVRYPSRAGVENPNLLLLPREQQSHCRRETPFLVSLAQKYRKQKKRGCFQKAGRCQCV